MDQIGHFDIQLHGWWRTASGHTEGDRLDDVIQKSPEGLPWIAGRTLKGLLRDAACQLCALGHARQDMIDAVFGLHVSNVHAPELAIEARYLTEPAAYRFGSGEMNPMWRDWASGAGKENAAARSVIAALFDRRSMTAIESDGLAKTGSLRRVEVAAPVHLTAPIWCLHDVPGAIDLLEKSAGLIKALGAGRTRGFGRVTVRLDLEQPAEERA
jgi:hypothetical protein